MTTAIKAIQTRYKGYRFRSRLEARWAVFFDVAGVKWEYEPEGFETPRGRYLPDFRLADFWEWIEIKPTISFDQDDLDKMVAFCQHKSLYVVCGSPWSGEYSILSAKHKRENKEYLITGLAPLDNGNARWGQCPLCGRVQVVFPHCSPDEHIGIYCEPCDMRCDTEDGWVADGVSYFHKGDVMCEPPFPFETDRVLMAFQAARSARFEHGESP